MLTNFKEFSMTSYIICVFWLPVYCTLLPVSTGVNQGGLGDGGYNPPPPPPTKNSGGGCI